MQKKKKNDKSGNLGRGIGINKLLKIVFFSLRIELEKQVKKIFLSMIRGNILDLY